MNTDKLTDAIGMIDEKYIDAAHPKKAVRSFWKPFSAVAAAACLCLAALLPTATAFGSDNAYSILYMLSPSVAQTFKPVQRSCEDNGIHMEVISAEIDGSKASIYISMQGDMLDETTDLYDSYNINCPFDNVGHVSFSYFDESTKTAYFVVHIETMNGEDIPKGKVTFSVRELIFGKQEFEGKIDEVDLSNVPLNPACTEDIPCVGYSIEVPDLKLPDSYKELSEKYLIPNEIPLAEPCDGIKITAVGYVDGILHIQQRCDNVLQNDNHGFLTLVNNDGEKVENYSTVSFWDENTVNQYQESLFSIGYNEIKDYSLYGEFFTSTGYKSGDWEVTFKMK